MCSEIIRPTDADYTFHSDSLNHFSWLDWMLISNDLGKSLVNFNIIDSALNLSDHLPIIIEFPLVVPGMADSHAPASSNRAIRTILFHIQFW